MNIVKLGKKGQVSIPREVLRRLGLEGNVTMLVDTTPDGAIVLRPVAAYPIEVYGDERVKEFDAEDRMDPKMAARLGGMLGKK